MDGFMDGWMDEIFIFLSLLQIEREDNSQERLECQLSLFTIGNFHHLHKSFSKPDYPFLLVQYNVLLGFPRMSIFVSLKSIEALA
jgi:hypothetical protein